MFVRSVRVGADPFANVFRGRVAGLASRRATANLPHFPFVVGPACLARAASGTTVATSPGIAAIVGSSGKSGGGSSSSTSSGMNAYGSAGGGRDAGPGDGQHSGARGFWPWGPPPRDRLIVELLTRTELRQDADIHSEVIAELPCGLMVEAFGNIDESREWLLVRSPVEDKVDIMSDMPLEYQDGWLRHASVKRAEHQLGDRVAALTAPESHPLFEALRVLPPWRGGPCTPGAPLPDWIIAAVSELHTGKIGGVVKEGRYVVQRPSGAMPARLATTHDLLLVPRDRARRTVLAGFIGLAISLAIGLAAHAGAWLRGERHDAGRMAWPQLVGWMSIVAVVLVPLTVMPCYTFANSQGSTMVVVAWINLLLYNDLFGE